MRIFLILPFLVTSLFAQDQSPSRWQHDAQPSVMLPSKQGQPGTAADFGIYLLAMTWLPTFCSQGDQCQKQEECYNNTYPFSRTHFTLHGLWPNYTQVKPCDKPSTYPTYCGPYKDCNQEPVPDSCKPGLKNIPVKELEKYGPGYISDNYYLANHEWPKHGSCTGLTAKVFLNEAVNQLKNLDVTDPHDGTPGFVIENIGKKVNREDLINSFGKEGTVVLGCDSDCNLISAGICFTKGEDNLPGSRTECPSVVTTSSYDNGCMTNQACSIINIPAFDCKQKGNRKGAVLPTPQKQRDKIEWGEVYAQDLTGSPSLGPSDAPVTLVIWSDFTCSFCDSANHDLKRLKQKYGDALRIVFKQTASNLKAQKLAKISMVAFAQGSFWKTKDWIFENHQQVHDLDFMQRAASHLQLDPKSLTERMGEPDITEFLEDEHQQALDLDLVATPTFFINGTRVNGGGIEALGSVIDHHLKL